MTFAIFQEEDWILNHIYVKLIEGVVSWFCLHRFWSSSLTSSNLIFLIHHTKQTCKMRKTMKNLYFSQVSQFFSFVSTSHWAHYRRKPPDSQRRRTVDMPGPREQGWGMNIYNIYIYNIYIQYIYIYNIYIYNIYILCILNATKIERLKEVRGNQRHPKTMYMLPNWWMDSLWKWAYQRLIWYPIVELYPNSQVDHSNHHVIMIINDPWKRRKGPSHYWCTVCKAALDSLKKELQRLKEESTRQVGRFGALQELSATFLLTIFIFAHQRCITSFGQAETSLVYPSFQWRLHGAQPCGLFAEVAEKEETWWRASRGFWLCRCMTCLGRNIWIPTWTCPERIKILHYIRAKDGSWWMIYNIGPESFQSVKIRSLCKHNQPIHWGWASMVKPTFIGSALRKSLSELRAQHKALSGMSCI